MTARLVSGRQYELTVETQVNWSTDSVNGVRIDLPPNAIVVGGFSNCITAFNGTTPTFSLIDNSTSPVSYLAAVASATAGVVTQIATAADGLFYPAGAQLTVSVGGTGVTTGVMLVVIRYVVDGRANESYTA